MQGVKAQDLQGIDVSRWQGKIDWDAVREDDIDFTYIKCTEGKGWVDPMFMINAKQARAAGIPVGAYHFARPDLNPTLGNALEEAWHFLETMQKGFADFGDLDPVLDLEVPYPRDEKVIKPLFLLAWVETFRKFFAEQTGRTLMLYSGVYFIREYNNFRHPGCGYTLADMPLWIAYYPKASHKTAAPPDLGKWTRWSVWQYTNKGKIQGIEGKVDLNRGLAELLTAS